MSVSKSVSIISLFTLIILIFIFLIKYNTNFTFFSATSDTSADKSPPPPFSINNSPPSSSSSSSNPSSSITPTTKEGFKKCIKKIAEVYYTETYRFFEELDVCMKVYFSIDYKKLDNFPNGATGERKVFLPMESSFQQKEECRWLTIGIGGLIAAEEQVHEKYPNCKIYGVEPSNQANFSTVGKVLSVGVGLEDSDKSNGIKLMSLPKILDEFVGSRLVHYLSIDIESYEMIVLPELIGSGKFANENITFCQIDAELHNPKQGGQHPDAEKINRVQWILDFLSESSQYLPVFTVSYQPAHKVTFVNFVNPECEKAFKISSYLNK